MPNSLRKEIATKLLKNNALEEVRRSIKQFYMSFGSYTCSYRKRDYKQGKSDKHYTLVITI